MSFGDTPEWAGEYLAPADWSGDEAFDPLNDLHLDRLAGALHFAFACGGDPHAFRRLVEVTTPRFQALSEEIAQDEGLVLPAANLLDAFWARTFVDLSKPQAPIAHFLSHASARMRGEAEAWARDLALADTPPDDDPAHFGKVVQIAFHRLDRGDRRLLRGKDVCKMSDEDLASRYDMRPAEVPAAVAAARRRLDELTRRLDGAEG